MALIVRISVGGRVTIPKKFRKALHLEVGDFVKIDWSIEGDKLCMKFTRMKVVPTKGSVKR